MTRNLTRFRTAAVIAAAMVNCAAAALASNIYVDDGFDVYSYTPAGARTTFSTAPGGTALEIALDSTGTLYAAARDSNEILKYSSTGAASVFATVNGPYGIAIDGAGDIFTGANFGSMIMEYTPAGVGSVFATGVGVQDLAFDSTGDLLDFDGSGNIYAFAPNGTKTVYAANAPQGFGMTVDSAGDVYADDWTQNTIDKYTPGSGWSVFGTMPDGQLATGLALDSSGDLFATEVVNGISNCCNQSVYEFTPAGVRSTFATGLYTPFGIAIMDASSATPAATPEPESLGWLTGAVMLLFVGKSAWRATSPQTAERVESWSAQRGTGSPTTR